MIEKDTAIKSVGVGMPVGCSNTGYGNMSQAIDMKKTTFCHSRIVTLSILIYCDEIAFVLFGNCIAI